MKEETIWRITLDRFANESLAKSGEFFITIETADEFFSVIETADLLIKKYKNQVPKPKIEVDTIGLGMALSEYLTINKIPHTRRKGILTRIGNADVLKYRGE